MKQIPRMLILWLLTTTTVSAAELVLPQGRIAFHSREPIELAISGLEPTARAKVAIVPESSASPVEFEVEGRSSTLVLPPYALAPSNYTVQLDGKAVGKLIVARGVNNSTMLMGSQGCNAGNAREWNCNYLVGNAFGFGLLDGDLKPMMNVRGQQTGIGHAFQQAVTNELPMMIYMYWTGVIAHQPWGAEKSWTDPQAVEAMRLFNFHVAQRLRRFRGSIPYVGTIDEPGLPHGRTPAGGLASGFPRWDEQSWYEARGWKFTNDPGARSDEDWMKYLTIRCGILKETFDQAKRDLKAVWPDMVFSSDLYAPFAIMDGTDPLNQEVNDIPSTHVFVDWGSGKLGLTGALYLEKAHNPSAKLTHAMNGQLVGENVPRPRQLDAYHLTLNALLAAGLHDNWWLGTSGLTAADITEVNDPALRLGPLFHEVSPNSHDVAVLWGFTEMGMRQKEIAAREAKKKPGEKIKLPVTNLPSNSLYGSEGTEIAVTAYEVGGNYKDTILSAHQALMRAGYPAHIIHERLLPSGALKKYKTLVIAGQTHEFPGEVSKALSEFQSAGGRIIVDRSTTVGIDGAIRSEASFKDSGFRWRALFDPEKFKTRKEGSFFQTNWFMDAQVREAVPAIAESMRQTASQPAIKTESVHLAAERHVGGEGALCMVINANETMPEIADNETYWVYNYAPQEATFTLTNLPESSVVYCIEGIDWKQTRQLEDPRAAQTAKFAAGEMKLFLVAPRAPKGLSVKAKLNQGALEVSAQLQELKMPWPVTLTLTAPGGEQITRIYRSLNENGSYQETFAIGSNAKPGTYRIHIESPLANLDADAEAELESSSLQPSAITDVARVFDEKVIQSFFSERPELVIAYGANDHQSIAERLARQLQERGIRASVAHEKQVFERAEYPRIWSPYATVYEPTGPSKNLEGLTPKTVITLERDSEGRTLAITSDGQNLRKDWRRAGTLVNVIGKGYLDWEGRRDEVAYLPGCQFYIDEKKNFDMLRGEPRKVETTSEFRAQWSLPWHVLDQYQGGRQLPPQLPEAYAADSHLILLGDSTSSELVRALQASELLPQIADTKYPGPGKALISFVWSPFKVEKNVVLVAAADAAGIEAGANRLRELATP